MLADELARMHEGQREISDCPLQGFTFRKTSLGLRLQWRKTASMELKQRMPVPVVGVVMGSQSDWDTMRNTSELLDALEVAHECKIVSAHRTPDRLHSYGSAAKDRGLKIIIAGAGGAAHLPGMLASKTLLPVIGVPVMSQALSGIDSLYSIVQMPRGCPVATMAIGKAGAANAALLAASILALSCEETARRLAEWRQDLTSNVPEEPQA